MKLAPVAESLVFLGAARLVFEQRADMDAPTTCGLLAQLGFLLFLKHVFRVPKEVSVQGHDVRPMMIFRLASDASMLS